MDTQSYKIVEMAQRIIDRDGAARLYFRSFIVDVVSLTVHSGVVEGTATDGRGFYFRTEHLDGVLATVAPDP